MLLTATVLLALTALGGLVMAAIRFTRAVNPPAWLAMLHGLLASAGLSLLIFDVFTRAVPPAAILSMVLFIAAAGGGAILSLVYKWRHRLLPAWLVAVHALLAACAFVLLVVAVLADH
ncbi:hypothetical protein [Agrilutibacter solisilvae]|uniref:Uncharacterized protein n=1 Tax=Agrilutibacter solisilvae TaxID=2763317 RepID=A0A975ARS8_9GAMM|nr:hypothetical protein [Lysobacter solisilvae]QSX78199.1 hypothetical protein I8J32_016175 [Lysobacter solisilvae]